MTAPAPASDSPEAPVDVGAPPPVPAALWQYPVYSARIIRYRRRLNRRLEALDLALRDAVQIRDEALATLGEATLAGETPTGRIAAFAETLAALDSERGSIDRRREALTIELAAAEADRRARLAEFDARLEGLEAELAPLERALDEHRKRREALDHEAEDADDLGRSLEARRAQIEQDVDADPDTRAIYAEELPGIEARLAELAVQQPDRAARRDALQGPLARLQGQVDELTALRESITARRGTWLEDVDGRIAELTAQRDDEHAALERSDQRRRAALVDLGREALHQEGGDRPGENARQALEHIVELRRQRKLLQATDAGLDTRPLVITVFGLLAVIVVALALRGC